jgi:hypothetical protein
VVTAGIYQNQSRYVFTIPSFYFNKSAPLGNILTLSSCGLINPVAPAGFYSSLSVYESANRPVFWPDYPPYFEPNASAMVSGFFGGCTPFDAVLTSTFDCLYNVSCLEVFADYFPALNQVCAIDSSLLYKTSLDIDKLQLDQFSSTFKPTESFFKRSFG